MPRIELQPDYLFIDCGYANEIDFDAGNRMAALTSPICLVRMDKKTLSRCLDLPEIDDLIAFEEANFKDFNGFVLKVNPNEKHKFHSVFSTIEAMRAGEKINYSSIFEANYYMEEKFNALYFKLD